MILSDEDIQEFNKSFNQESARALTRTRQFRKLMGKVNKLSSGNVIMPMVMIDVMYAGIGRIKGFPEEKCIKYSGEVAEVWGYLVEKIDSCTEKKELYNRLMIICIIADRLNKMSF
ncbi:MAG: hypothetical protein BWY21_00424 [Parcubacteria group bacterium ADurb.Bin216]|nr:MAG: hypothetical protein BWY21_00424 [Parcubacteria group bacterium ADurb.Bin216]